MRKKTDDLFNELETVSRGLGPDSCYYWDRHHIRFRRVLSEIQQLQQIRPCQRILDVGMSIQTIMLCRAFPDAQIDCLGYNRDTRYAPDRSYNFYRVDLNRLVEPSEGQDVPRDVFDLIVFMEVIEHLYTAPSIVLGYLTQLLRPSGVLLLTTPNAVWVKNRVKMILGKNPFEPLREDHAVMGHIREYTLTELDQHLREAGLEKIKAERCGLYHFSGAKDRLYSWFADHTHRTLSRSLLMIYQKPPARLNGAANRMS